jgi:hypothetical protein
MQIENKTLLIYKNKQMQINNFNYPEAKLALDELSLKIDKVDKQNLYLLSNIQKILQNLFVDLEYSYIISTFSFSDVVQSNHNKLLNFKICYCKGKINEEEILSNLLKNKMPITSINIIVIDPFYLENTEVESVLDRDTNNNKVRFQIIIKKVNLHVFFKNIVNYSKFISPEEQNDIIGMNPIIIFKGIS